MGGERVTVLLRYQTRLTCEYIQRMMGKEKTKPKNHTSFLPLSWSSFSLQSPLQKEIKHRPLLFPHLFSVYPQSLNSASSSLAWGALHFYPLKHLVLPWKQCQVVIKPGSFVQCAATQNAKMPRFTAKEEYSKGNQVGRWKGKSQMQVRGLRPWTPGGIICSTFEQGGAQ